MSPGCGQVVNEGLAGADVVDESNDAFSAQIPCDPGGLSVGNSRDQTPLEFREPPRLQDGGVTLYGNGNR